MGLRFERAEPDRRREADVDELVRAGIGPPPVVVVDVVAFERVRRLWVRCMAVECGGLGDDEKDEGELAGRAAEEEVRVRLCWLTMG